MPLALWQPCEHCGQADDRPADMPLVCLRVTNKMCSGSPARGQGARQILLLFDPSERDPRHSKLCHCFSEAAN